MMRHIRAVTRSLLAVAPTAHLCARLFPPVDEMREGESRQEPGTPSSLEASHHRQCCHFRIPPFLSGQPSHHCAVCSCSLLDAPITGRLRSAHRTCGSTVSAPHVRPDAPPEGVSATSAPLKHLSARGFLPSYTATCAFLLAARSGGSARRPQAGRSGTGPGSPPVGPRLPA